MSDDLDGDNNMVFPLDLSEIATAQLLLQGELFFGEFPFICCEMVQIWGVGLDLQRQHT